MSLRADPRPRYEEVSGQVRVVGGHCPGCGLATVADTDVCPVCQTELEESRYGPEGEVVASTVLRVGLADRPPPYAVAYVVLDAGPRVLAHTPDATLAPVGTRVRLTAPSQTGDLQVEAVPEVSA